MSFFGGVDDIGDALKVLGDIPELLKDQLSAIPNKIGDELQKIPDKIGDKLENVTERVKEELEKVPNVMKEQLTEFPGKIVDATSGVIKDGLKEICFDCMDDYPGCYCCYKCCSGCLFICCCGCCKSCCGKSNGSSGMKSTRGVSHDYTPVPIIEQPHALEGTNSEGDGD